MGGEKSGGCTLARKSLACQTPVWIGVNSNGLGGGAGVVDEGGAAVFESFGGGVGLVEPGGVGGGIFAEAGEGFFGSEYGGRIFLL